MKKTTTFKAVKAKIIKLAKEHNACKEEFAKVVKSKNFLELAKIMYINSRWCFNHGFFTDGILFGFPIKILNEAGIYYNQQNINIYGSRKVTAYNSSNVTAYDSSNVTAYNSSNVTACGSSNVTAYDSSNVTAYNSSNVTACGSSNVTAYDSSNVTACGSSEVTACDSSYISARYINQIKEIKDNAIIYERDTNTVHVNTNVKVKIHKIKK